MSKNQKRDKIGRWAATGTRSAFTSGQRKLMLAPHKEALRQAQEAHGKAQAEHTVALAKPRDKKSVTPHGYKTQQAVDRARVNVGLAHEKLRAVRRGAGSSSSELAKRKALTDAEATAKHKEITARSALDREARAKALAPAKEAHQKAKAEQEAAEYTGRPELDRAARGKALAPAKKAAAKAQAVHEKAAGKDREARQAALAPHKEAFANAKAKWRAVLDSPEGPRESDRKQHEKMHADIASTRANLRQARREAGRGGKSDTTRAKRSEAREALRAKRREVGTSKVQRLWNALGKSEEALKEKRREVGRSNRAERYGRWATK